MKSASKKIVHLVSIVVVATGIWMTYWRLIGQDFNAFARLSLLPPILVTLFGAAAGAACTAVAGRLSRGVWRFPSPYVWWIGSLVTAGGLLLLVCLTTTV